MLLKLKRDDKDSVLAAIRNAGDVKNVRPSVKANIRSDIVISTIHTCILILETF